MPSTRVPEMSRPGFEPPGSFTAAGHSSKELLQQLNAAYSIIYVQIQAKGLYFTEIRTLCSLKEFFLGGMGFAQPPCQEEYVQNSEENLSIIIRRRKAFSLQNVCSLCQRTIKTRMVCAYYDKIKSAPYMKLISTCLFFKPCNLRRKLNFNICILFCLASHRQILFLSMKEK
jgi:hypothetical protein